jgi:hypothetical protein
MYNLQKKAAVYKVLSIQKFKNIEIVCYFMGGRGGEAVRGQN